MAVPSPAEIMAQEILKSSKDIHPFGDHTMPELGLFIEMSAPNKAVAEALATILRRHAETEQELKSIVIDNDLHVFASIAVAENARHAIRDQSADMNR